MTTQQPTGIERRRSVRKPARKMIQIRWRGANAQRETTTSTTSISRFGCAAVGDESLRTGEEVRVEYGGKVMTGAVCYLMRNAITGEIEVGISFPEDAAEFWEETF